VDPFDIKYFGLYWRGAYYVDTTVPFRYHHGTQACVHVTDAFHFILARMGILVLNYIDDIIGIAPDDVADSNFKITLNLLNNLYYKSLKNCPSHFGGNLFRHCFRYSPCGITNSFN
jgi:hypothetical protein